MHAMLATWPIECYSYSYCVRRRIYDIIIIYQHCTTSKIEEYYMHADLTAAVSAVYLSSFAQKTKSWAKLLAILLPFPCIGVILVYIAKYCTVWATFSR